MDLSKEVVEPGRLLDKMTGLFFKGIPKLLEVFEGFGISGVTCRRAYSGGEYSSIPVCLCFPLNRASSRADVRFNNMAAGAL